MQKGLKSTSSAHLPLWYWSSLLFDLRSQLSTDVPVLLLNQPCMWILGLNELETRTGRRQQVFYLQACHGIELETIEKQILPSCLVVRAGL